MNFLSSHRLHITPLSPVHIGCNETYEPTNYVIDGDALYEFNADNAIASLPKAAQEQLLKIVSGKPNEEMLKQVQAFFHQHREVLMAQAEHYFPVGEGVAELYDKRIGKTAQHESRGKQVINKLEIERSSYNLMDRKPMFPGSSIKGAIRTALLDEVNDGNPLSQEIRGKKPFQQNQALQESLFEGRFATDPMRLVSVGDARWSAEDAAPGNEIRFAVNRQRKPKEGQRLQQSMAEEKGLYQILECVSSLQPRCLTTTLNLHKPQVLSNRQTDKLPKSELQWSARDIAAACNRFYQKLLMREVEAMRKQNYLDGDWLTVMGQLLSAEMLQKLERNEAFLLRVGRHSGAEAVTLEGVRNGQIRIKSSKKGGDKFMDAPQTWWLAASDTDSKGSMMPFGWVLIEIDADTSQPLPAQADLESFNTHRKQWFDKQQQYKQQLQTRLAEQQRVEQERLQSEQKARQQQEEQARLQAEQEAAEAAAREAALAQMNPIEREIAEFATVLDALTALESGQWEGDQQQAAQFLKQRMQAENTWKESTTAKKPEKDKAYQRTLTVMKHL
ncbi:MAG: type III-A CRISPR-associated RAMP protein Csm5 [Thiolinea sp.]